MTGSLPPHVPIALPHWQFLHFFPKGSISNSGPSRSPGVHPMRHSGPLSSAAATQDQADLDTQLVIDHVGRLACR